MSNQIQAAELFLEQARSALDYLEGFKRETIAEAIQTRLACSLEKVLCGISDLKKSRYSPEPPHYEDRALPLPNRRKQVAFCNAIIEVAQTRRREELFSTISSLCDPKNVTFPAKAIIGDADDREVTDDYRLDAASILSVVKNCQPTARQEPAEAACEILSKKFRAVADRGTAAAESALYIVNNLHAVLDSKNGVRVGDFSMDLIDRIKYRLTKGMELIEKKFTKLDHDEGIVQGLIGQRAYACGLLAVGKGDIDEASRHFNAILDATKNQPRLTTLGKNEGMAGWANGILLLNAMLDSQQSARCPVEDLIRSLASTAKPYSDTSQPFEVLLEKEPCVAASLRAFLHSKSLFDVLQRCMLKVSASPITPLILAVILLLIAMSGTADAGWGSR